MRELTVAGLTGSALLVLALIVFGAGDRETVVPAPEAVAESLLRQLAANRPSQTKQYLSTRARQMYPPGALASWFAKAEREAGDVRTINGKDAAFDRNQARATVVIEGRRRILPVRMVLVREQGLWYVERLIDFR